MHSNHSDHWEREIIEECLMAAVKEKRTARRWGILFKMLFIGYLYLLFFSFYQWSKGTGGMTTDTAHTALIDIRGEIGDKEEANADAVASSLREAFEQKNAQGIILRINSPGGSPVQAGYIFDEIKRLRQLHSAKKIYAVISDVGASAGYFIAAAADEIYADPASIVGSIGVIMPSFGVVDLMQKVGVENRTLSSGEHKDFYDPFSPVKETDKIHGQNLIAGVHQQFIQKVKVGRGLRLKEDPLVFTGLFWSGEQALGLGLIDGLGSSGFVARELIKAEVIVDYSVSTDLLDRLASKIGAFLNSGFQLKLKNSYPQLS